MTILAIILHLAAAPHPAHHDFVAEVSALPSRERALLVALAWSESTFDPEEESRAGACGILQLMPKWVDASCEELKADVGLSVKLAREELAKWKRNCGEEWMLAAWNAGYGCCKGGWYYRQRAGKQEFNCSPRAEQFQAKVWRRAEWVSRRLAN